MIDLDIDIEWTRSSFPFTLVLFDTEPTKRLVGEDQPNPHAVGSTTRSQDWTSESRRR